MYLIFRSFIVYINDLADVVNCNIKLFADDTCLYVKIDDQSQVMRRLGY